MSRGKLCHPGGPEPRPNGGRRDDRPLDPRSALVGRQWVPPGEGPGHPAGMHASGPRRFRCTWCREWFTPHPSVVGVQKTCSLTCRRKRRRSLARRRRGRDLDRYRDLERSRQKRRRLAQARSGGLVQGPHPAMSRAGLSLQVTVLLEDTLRTWDKAVATSRAGLARELLQTLQVAMGSLRQDETRSAECHAPTS